jgi:hypothetical protein
VPDTATLESLVRASDGAAGLRPLLRALGLAGSVRGDVAPDGLRQTEGVRDVAIVGDAAGLRSVLVRLDMPARRPFIAALGLRLQSGDPLHPHLLIAADPDFARLTFAAAGLDGGVRQVTLDRRRPGRAELEMLAELAAAEGEGGTALALRHARALERSRVTRRFFRDFRGRRDAIAAAWLGLPAALEPQRDALALLFLSRLMFLYFLQREGHLAGDPAYLPRLARAPAQASVSLYRQRLEPLFFGALNRRPEQRDTAARDLGDLPYLNGGLFERHPLERQAPDLDLPDDVVLSAFDLLLDRYRFTTRESGDDDDGDAGIDPEMLGRVFEGLMAPARRGDTGSFYTPAATVDRLTRETIAVYATSRAGLAADEAAALVRGRRPESLTPDRAQPAARQLARLHVLDPACGSGAFLLGALGAIGRARLALGEGEAREIRRDIVARALHGVDVQADAALLCALRLWLALAQRPAAGATGPVPPLPNLDMRIRQGDALLDPMDLLLAGNGQPGLPAAPADRPVRAAIARIRPLAERYLTAEPEERQALRAALRDAESGLADAWLGSAAARLDFRRRELEAAARERDLFDERTDAALLAEREREGVRRTLADAEALRTRLRQEGALPFFSFPVHFADAADRGFDVILSNPPWLRAHRWPPAMRRLVRVRYDVCRTAGWRRGALLAGAPEAAAAQVDLALLFLERSIGLLAPGGVLGMVLPAKMLRSLYGAGGRRLLLQRARLVALEDHSLDQHSLFRADAFAATIVAERPVPDAPPTPPPPVRVLMVRRRVQPLRFAVDAHELPLVPGDPDSPWLLAPPAARLALRRMQRCPPLGDDGALRVRRGVFTGANDCLLISHADHKLGGLARIRARGAERGGDGHGAAAAAYDAIVEARGLAPAVRGRGISAWDFEIASHVVWLHDDDTGAALPPPPRLARYLERHAAALDRRRGAARGAPRGALFRVTADTLRPKVAWQDLCETLEAVALPARVAGPGGEPRPLVPLNTVYFIPVSSPPEALVLAAYLNSLPVRTFARAVAERAKDARFRFFAWVIALLPLPGRWRSGDTARRLLALARDAHEAGAISPAAQGELDALVARAYGLSDGDVAALGDFDRWLRGSS